MYKSTSEIRTPLFVVPRVSRIEEVAQYSSSIDHQYCYCTEQNLLPSNFKQKLLAHANSMVCLRGGWQRLTFLANDQSSIILFIAFLSGYHTVSEYRARKNGRTLGSGSMHPDPPILPSPYSDSMTTAQECNEFSWHLQVKRSGFNIVMTLPRPP